MFFRTVVFLLLAILALTFLRMFAGILTKGIGAFFEPPQRPHQVRNPPQAPAGGELKRDPVCGTFVAAEASLTKTIHGETFHFCSAACRDKFRV